MRKVEVGMIVSWLTSVLVGMSIFGAAASAHVESTGFEAADGWVAGYSICGPEFAATCSYPITNACVPNDHAASQNCCEDDPNEHTGWYMDDYSQHCYEPHIDTANPFSGSLHLRFARDSAGGNPPGCTGYSFNCMSAAYTPRTPAQPLAPTTVSFEISGSNTGGSSLQYVALAADDPAGTWTAGVYFQNTGDLLIFDAARDSWFTSSWEPGGVYRNFTIQLDPCSDVVQYFYAGKLILSTVFGPWQASTLQSAFFKTNNDSGVWDIDDYSVTRGPSCRNPCGGVGTRTCGSGPCATLKAVGVNGNPISPTECVQARPGDLIETEIYISGWGENIQDLRVYQLDLLLQNAAVSGTSGTVLPLGWDAPLDFMPCSAGCPLNYSICSSECVKCVGPNHDPEMGAFITRDREDYALFGHSVESLIATCYLHGYKFVGVADDSGGRQDEGVPVYAGTLILKVSDDACGAFTFQFDDPETFLGDSSQPPQVVYPLPRWLRVNVCAENGAQCEGVGFCEGACCDQQSGDCQNAVVKTACACPNCVWTGAVDCADIECEAEFVAIPTVSQWGLVVLTLLLLTGAKIGFGRRPANSSTKPAGSTH